MHAQNLKWMPILIFLGGVLSTEWYVDYQQQNICAVKGSSVIIPCAFKYPEKETVQSVKWGHERNDKYIGPFLYDSQLQNNVSSRFQFIGDKTHNCSFKIHHVQQDDAGKYVFRFITNSINGQWSGLEGSPTLKIVDLDVLATNETLMEGDSVDLTCIYSCDGKPPSEFTWFKDGKPIHEGQRLHLGNTSSTVSGSYSCSLTEHKGTASGVKHISVQHGPKNTSASVTPSAEVKPESKVTLICSSYANPPVENYTWFRMSRSNNQTVGHKPEYHIKDVLQNHGQYFCTATNKHGSQNSSVVTLKVQEFQTTLNKNRLIIAFSVMTLLAVIIFVSIQRSCKKRTKPAESEPEVDTQKEQHTLANAEDPIYANCGNKEPIQEESCHEGKLIYATVTAKKTTDRVKQMDPGDDDGCVIYSTVCRT